MRQQLGDALSFDASSRRNSGEFSPSYTATGANAIALNSPTTPNSSTAQNSPAINVSWLGGLRVKLGELFLIT